MDLFSFLTVIFVSAVYAVTVYFNDKRTKEFFDKLMEKFSEKQVVSFPWEQAVDNPEAQTKDEDHIPLEEADEDEVKKSMGHMFTTETKDTEAEKAQEEVN